MYPSAFRQGGEHLGERLCPPEIFRGPFGVVWVCCDAGRNARFLSVGRYAQLALPLLANVRQESSRRKDRNAVERVENQQILVAGHKTIRASYRSDFQ